MRLGMMNDPRQDPIAEIGVCARAGLDFLDLTLEPPRTASEQVDVVAVGAALADAGLGVIGHTCYFLPIASPYPALRRAALDEMRRSMDAFAALGARLVNVHPQEGGTGLSAREWLLREHTDVLWELVQKAQERGLTLMLENGAALLHQAGELEAVLADVPGLALELDLAHANLNAEGNRGPELIRRLRSHIRHVHISDNRGGREDMHLPLGAGTINWGPVVRTLKASGYDEGITLEIHSKYREYLLVSRDKLTNWWERPEESDSDDEDH